MKFFFTIFIKDHVRGRIVPIALLLLWSLLPGSALCSPLETAASLYEKDILYLSSLGDRSTGTYGNIQAGLYIKKTLKEIGFHNIGSHTFSVPVRKHFGSALIIPETGMTHPIHPMKAHVISPGNVPKNGIEGPLIYVGRGHLEDFNHKDIQGSIILMDMDSGKNWLHAASLGAKALIYLDRGDTVKFLFEEKIELTPIKFPRFWMSLTEIRKLFNLQGELNIGEIQSSIRITSTIRWTEVEAENIYCFIEGEDPDLNEEMIIIEAFYDSSSLIYGKSPGADEALGISSVLDLARSFKTQPPARSVLLIATNGHAQTLSGMREIFWGCSSSSRDIRNMEKSLNHMIEGITITFNLIKDPVSGDPMDILSEPGIQDAVRERIKMEVDLISRRLMRLRMEEEDEVNKEIIDTLVEQRLALRRLSWREDFNNLSMHEKRILRSILPKSINDMEAILFDAQKKLKNLQSLKKITSLIKSRELVASISLHLSSNGDGFGAFNQGWLYPLKPNINRITPYIYLEQSLRDIALRTEEDIKTDSIFRDTLRPNRLRHWDSYFLDKPPLGGEISSMAGYLGISLVTVNDERAFWGTPSDLPINMDLDYAKKQNRFLVNMLLRLAHEPGLKHDESPRKGLSSVTGRVNFIRHGELFPDQPAPGSIILAYQGPSIYHSIVDNMGLFELNGVADASHVQHKVILEGYKFDPEDGSVIWAIDKNQTGKEAYRVKMQRRTMETDLIMFACKQMTLFDLLEPRTFNYMTKIQLFDGRREATPLRYWWSRIDTMSSTIASIYLEPGTPLKMTLSDSMLNKKLILTNSDEANPNGKGYIIDDWPFIHNTSFAVAKDMWYLLGPRISNLETHGIYNEKIRELHEEGTDALEEAKKALTNKEYDRFLEASSRSWALASRVYAHVEKTQKDVLFGVLFYIALFVPFAFCMERLLFCYSNINKRIIAFLGILILLIVIIYNVHPAFQLAYSPMVVILAFFIIGLSVIVSLIIFFRFEEEISRLQRRAQTINDSELGRWKAFTAAFLLGVSNLRRRRVRTALTCITLIILTFTIMSFTSVKSIRHHTRTQFNERSPYNGIMFKIMNWWSLPPESLDLISLAFPRNSYIAPRVWYEQEDKTRSPILPIDFKGKKYEARGLVGLSSEEANVSGIDEIIIQGRWIRGNERNVVLISSHTADYLKIDLNKSRETMVKLLGFPYRVVGIFDGKAFQERGDLDGEPLTPIIFPTEASALLTEIEIESEDSVGENKTFQSPYQHISGEHTIIMSYTTLLSLGGSLKSIAIGPDTGEISPDKIYGLVDRFGLSLFSGEDDGSYIYNATDTMSYSGVPNIIIPLIISIFIVLNTMIGSVYERKREIAVYTSVGLAPSHVSFLFVAESIAFAVISVVIGYLFAQVTAFLMAGTSLWSGITVNYSSMSGVGAMILVIGVVLVSVIYPSKVAGEIAIPDVNRSWKLPDVDGQVLDLTLPFLMKYREQRSIGGFIYDYFNAHQDVSHGIFSTGEILVTHSCPYLSELEVIHKECLRSNCEESSCLVIHGKVWLAPFDLGITQNVDIQFCPSVEEKDFLEIQIRLEREAGEANTWKRINKGFLNQLRKQLLIWRSLDAKDQNYYEEISKNSEICVQA